MARERPPAGAQPCPIAYPEISSPIKIIRSI